MSGNCAAVPFLVTERTLSFYNPTEALVNWGPRSAVAYARHQRVGGLGERKLQRKVARAAAPPHQTAAVADIAEVFLANGKGLRTDTAVRSTAEGRCRVLHRLAKRRATVPQSVQARAHVQVGV